MSFCQSVLGASETPREESRGKSDRLCKRQEFAGLEVVGMLAGCTQRKMSWHESVAVQQGGALCRAPPGKLGSAQDDKEGPGKPCGESENPVTICTLSVHYVLQGITLIC